MPLKFFISLVNNNCLGVYGELSLYTLNTNFIDIYITRTNITYWSTLQDKTDNGIKASKTIFFGFFRVSRLEYFKAIRFTGEVGISKDLRFFRLLCKMSNTRVNLRKCYFIIAYQAFFQFFNLHLGSKLYYLINVNKNIYIHMLL